MDWVSLAADPPSPNDVSAARLPPFRISGSATGKGHPSKQVPITVSGGFRGRIKGCEQTPFESSDLLVSKIYSTYPYLEIVAKCWLV